MDWNRNLLQIPNNDNDRLLYPMLPDLKREEMPTLASTPKTSNHGPSIFRVLGALYDVTDVVGGNLALALEEMLPRNSMLFLN